MYFSSVTDAYQPIEEKTGITRKLLKMLVALKFPVTIQTKSALVLRDSDILKDAGSSAFLLSAWMTKEKGIGTFCMVAPVLPGITKVSMTKNRLG